MIAQQRPHRPHDADRQTERDRAARALGRPQRVAEAHVRLVREEEEVQGRGDDY